MVYTINLWYQIPASGASTFLYKIIVPILTEIPLFGQNVEKCGADAIFESSAPGSRGLSFFTESGFLY